MTFDDDALHASVDVVGRSGAKDLEIGYQREDVPAEEADWYAQASWQGIRLIEEHHRGPVEAVEALARRVLTGAACTHCGGLIALSDKGAWVVPGSRMLDGSTMTEERARSMRQCRWRREGPTWIPGCQHGPSRNLSRG